MSRIEGQAKSAARSKSPIGRAVNRMERESVWAAWRFGERCNEAILLEWVADYFTASIFSTDTFLGSNVPICSRPAL